MLMLSPGGVSLAAAAPIALDLSEPVPGVFVHTGRQLALSAPGHDDIANIGFIVGEICVAVIDTGGSMTMGRALRAAIATHTRLPICYVVNTHAHVDHVLGNAAFKHDGTSFVGSARLADAIARTKEFFLTRYGGDLDAPATADQIVSPDRAVEHELTLDLGNRPLTLRAWPVAHTDSDLTVFDNRTGTLWTGDLLFRERLPAVDGSAKGWLSAIDDLARWKVRLAIPGHGAVTRDFAAALDPERRYLQALLDGVHGQLMQGGSLQDAMNHVARDESRHWLLWEEGHEHNVARVYEELEWE